MFIVRRVLIVAGWVAAVSCRHGVPTSQPSLSHGALVERIEVAGNRAITTDAIMAKIQTKAGDKINIEAIKRDTANVRSLGFEDVRVEEGTGASGGKIITFSVREKVP